MKKRVNKILALALAALLCTGVFGCKYKDVAGTYRATKSDDTVATLVLKTSGKFTYTNKPKIPAANQKYTFTGTFTVNDKTITLNFDKDPNTGEEIEPVSATIVSGGNLQMAGLTYKKQ